VCQPDKHGPEYEVMKLEAKKPFYQTEADGIRRKGRVFTLRLEPKAEADLLELYKAFTLIREDLPWPRPSSFGAFVVWAARQWKPKARR
jgi:hypothetical protein